MKNKSLPSDPMHRLQYLKLHYENLLVDLVGILEEVDPETPVSNILLSSEFIKAKQELDEEGEP
jgi:hypothetical protein